MVSTTDKFYYKVQSKLITLLCTGEINSKDVVVVPWDTHFWYLTWDRVTFYFIPEAKFFIKDSFKREVRDWFEVDNSVIFLSRVLNLKLEQVNLTGHQRVLSIGLQRQPSIGIEFSNGEWVLQSNLDLFPKQLFYCRSNDLKAPIFIFSNLKVSLGGVWPLTEAPV